ncbi:MAG: ribonuclease P protein component [Rickettsiales bacterium]|nr:ribonuclease P protein component [Rickettsiales bacterium]|tara:strand:+ start:16089 stop:16487 length:399 start_codon:yes stop_codon:yes gene_type:complete
MHPIGRISSKQDFGRLRRDGIRFHSRLFSTSIVFSTHPKKFKPNPNNPSPLIFSSFTITKKNFKRAVDRNRIKRRLRPLIQNLSQQLLEKQWTAPFMINIYARPAITEASYAELTAEFSKLHAMIQQNAEGS